MQQEKVLSVPMNVDEKPVDASSIQEEIGNYGKYIVDASLCGVGSHLRKLGVDTEFSKQYSDAYILFLARTQQRIIITRSTKLMERINQQAQRLENNQKKLAILKDPDMVKSLVEQRLRKPRTDEELEEEKEELMESIAQEQNYNYYWVKSIGKYDQLREVVNHFKIVYIKDNLFARCFSCNGVVTEVQKEDIVDQVFDKTYLNNDKFCQCQSCKQIFWGSENGNPYQRYVLQDFIDTTRKFFSNSKTFCQEYSYHKSEDVSN